MVKRSERPPVSKGEIQLYVPPGRQKDRSRSESPVSMKPLGQELSQLVARKPVQEFKQRFLDRAVGGSAGMPMSRPVYSMYETERKLVESSAQVEADDRAAREQMEREEAEHVAQAEEERARQEDKCMEEELEQAWEDQQKFVTKGAQAISEAQITQKATAEQKSPVTPKVEITEPKKVGSSVGQVPRQSQERTGSTIPFGCQ